MPRVTRMTILLLFWLLFLIFLGEFRNFLYPLCLAVLFAYLLYPLANFLEKHRIPRILANLISIIIGITVIYGVMMFIYKRLQFFLTDLPQLEQQAIKNLDSIFYSIQRDFGYDIPDDQESRAEQIIRSFFQMGRENIGDTINATFNTFFSIFIIPVYIFFFLYYRNKFKAFILKMIPQNKHELANDTIKELNSVTIKYMTGVFMVVLILCGLNSAGLLIIGVQYAILWGVVAAIINFIPYFGTIIGYSIPFIVALLTGDSPQIAIGVVVLFIIVQFIENNILTPNIVGGQVRINPFFIILGVLFGGVIWGLPGMFIVVPLLGMIKIICDKVPEFQHWGFLMGDTGTEKHALTFTKVRKFFYIKRQEK